MNRYLFLFTLCLVSFTLVAQRGDWGTHVLDHDHAWFASEEAVALANSVIQYQSPQGGWPKNTDLTKVPRSPEDVPAPGTGRANTIDNNATTVPMAFLAQVIHATGTDTYKPSFYRGLDYLFAAQYPNGGWPQFWPLRGDEYYSRITYNDEAMVQVLELLREVAAGNNEFDFVTEDYRKRALEAVNLGLDCILKTQIQEDGKLKVWCAQYDEHTLEPAWARAYEPPSFSGSESVGIIRFLMSVDQPSPEIIAAVEGAVEWLQSAAMHDVGLKRQRNPDGRTETMLVDQAGAPPLWARFYELKTERPLYLDRDSKFRYNYDEISYERRSGYAYHGYWPAILLGKEYPQWRSKNGLTTLEKRAAWVAEAEAGTFTGIVDRHSCWHNVMLSEAAHSSHSGRGLVDTRNEVDSYVEVSYRADRAEPHRLTVRYTHIKADPRPAALSVNGEVLAKLDLPQSEALSAWATQSVEVSLQQGWNTIRLSALQEGGLPTIDYVKVAETSIPEAGMLPRVQVLEAEDGKFTGKEDHHSCWTAIAQTEGAHSGFTGEGYVDTYNKKASYVEVSWEAPQRGEYEVSIRYVHGKTDVRPASLSVDGEERVASIPFGSTGGWTSWSTLRQTLYLDKGTHTFRLTALGPQGLVNTDHLAFKLVSY